MITSLSLKTSSNVSSSSIFYFKIIASSSHCSSSSLISLFNCLYYCFFCSRVNYNSSIIAVFCSISKILISISCLSWTISYWFFIIWASLLIITSAEEYISSNFAILSLSKSLYCVTLAWTVALSCSSSSSLMGSDLFAMSPWIYWLSFTISSSVSLIEYIKFCIVWIDL